MLKFQTRIINDPDKITDEDIAKIKQFTCSNQILSNIKRLEIFTNLQSLQDGTIKYSVNKISRWISLIVKPGLFDIKERLVMTLSPLTNLTSLQWHKLMCT